MTWQGGTAPADVDLETSIAIYGPFDTEKEAKSWGEWWQDDSGDDPRWHLVMLSNDSIDDDVPNDPDLGVVKLLTVPIFTAFLPPGVMKELWWLSFVDDGKLLGAAVVRADTMVEAVQERWRLELNPGGTVMAYDMDDIPEDMINRFTPVKELVERKFVTPRNSLTRGGKNVGS
jgi:hypothetical protein